MTIPTPAIVGGVCTIVGATASQVVSRLLLSPKERSEIRRAEIESAVSQSVEEDKVKADFREELRSEMRNMWVKVRYLESSVERWKIAYFQLMEIHFRTRILCEDMRDAVNDLRERLGLEPLEFKSLPDVPPPPVDPSYPAERPPDT